MRFTLLSHGEPVGGSDLETYDPDERTARGSFRPGPAWPRVRAVYARARAAAERRAEAPRAPAAAEQEAALAELAAFREELGFALVDAGGRAVATAGIGVGPNDAGELELEVSLARPEEWLATYGAPCRAGRPSWAAASDT